jgi:PKD repeat protein
VVALNLGAGLFVWTIIPFTLQPMSKPVRLALWFCILLLSACFKEVGIPVTTDFIYTAKDSIFTVPANINFTNRTIGATHFKWTFEGGEPASSEYENPGTVLFKQAGTYKITLEAWNEDERQVKTQILQLDSAVNIGFDARVLINEFSPVTVRLINNTVGASAYSWTFENGDPASSSLQSPPDVTFTTPGTHAITLKVTNGGQEFTTVKTITVKPPLVNDFSMEPVFDNDDYEAPLTAILESKAENLLERKWTAKDGIIANDTAANTTVYFKDPGTYTVTLVAENGKESKTVTKTITVKPNTGLRTMTDIKLGINAAQSTIGCYYAPRLRKVFRKGDDLSVAGKDIDIVFFGLNQGFSYNQFISPDSTAWYAFSGIPGAPYTRFINSSEACGCNLDFTVADFDAMTNDRPLKNIQLDATAEGGVPFTNAITPRIVVFQTTDGRKGAIKIKSFVSDGTSSYILLDIKVQK